MAKKRPLRSGYTTGACAAAAAKAAAERLLGLGNGKQVEIPLPGEKRARFKVRGLRTENGTVYASVVKDAGDDPDVTNGAEIAAEVRRGGRGVTVKGGHGVGKVTRPGLPVKPGRAAINPIPMKMIKEAVNEARDAYGESVPLMVTIIVPQGEELAKKTLNARLGIVGGISILGTTGIVRPLSMEAWRATITSSLHVAQASGFSEVVLSAGRTSEKAHMKKYNFPETAYVMMGDHVEWSLIETRKYPFKKIHLAAQWAKMVKIAMGTPDTHVRAGALDTAKSVEFLREIGVMLPLRDYNTAMEMYQVLDSKREALKVCRKAEEYAAGIVGLPVQAHLVSYEGEIISADG